MKVLGMDAMVEMVVEVVMGLGDVQRIVGEVG